MAENIRALQRENGALRTTVQDIEAVGMAQQMELENRLLSLQEQLAAVKQHEANATTSMKLRAAKDAAMQHRNEVVAHC